MKPNYQKIYTDIIKTKYPEKMIEFEILLRNNQLDVLSILRINREIFGTTDTKTESFNQRLKSYNKTDIKKILNYQKKCKLTNVQLANHFKLSRNTIAKWKKMEIQ